MMTCIALEKEAFHQWNDFVKMHPDGTVFHQTGWLSLVGDPVTIYTVWKEDELVGGVALVTSKKMGSAGFHIPPYTQYFSPLYYNKNNTVQSVSEEHECMALLLEKIGHASHVDFKLTAGHHSILPYHWKGYETSVMLTHLVRGTKEAYFSGLNKNKQRELRKLYKAMDAGEISVEEHISQEELTELIRKTSDRKNFDPKTDIVLKLVNRAKEIPAKTFAIRSNEFGVVAFGFLPYDDKAMYNLVNVSIRGTNSTLRTVNLLLINKAIEFALENNLVFDFEGSMLPGVESFFREMGGKQVPVYRVQKSGSIKYSLLRALKQIKNDRKKA